jgi:hypothetical protein
VRERFNQLEVALRIKSYTGTLLSEHIIRGQNVELISYFPSGLIQRKTDIPLELFIEEVQKMLKSDTSKESKE